MDRRAWLVDGALGAVAFALSAAILGAATPVGPDVRDADVLAYALVGAHSVALVLRTGWPVAAVVLGLGTALAYSAASYPLALTPVALLAVHTAAVRLHTRSAGVVQAFAVVVAALAATLAPGPTSTSPPDGLAGMRERVAVHGGSLETGPSPTGGFRVVARLPVGGA